MKVFTFAVLILCLWHSEARSLVASTTDVSTTSQQDGDPKETNKTIAKPVMKYFHVQSDIKYRFAHTLVSTKIANPAEVAQEVSFSAVLPDTAYISGFVMEVDGKAYKAYVKEKEEAKQVYDQAVQHGQTAAHVALTARDANRFTVSVNVEPRKKVTFNLTYEELLSRKLGTYKDIINLDPGQIVDDFSVIVRIQESSNITTIKVPALRVSNEINEDSETDSTNSLAKIEHPTPQVATVTFAPNADQQRELASDGLKGQLIVEYDVDRTSNPGEVLVNDGYFVHFFSPSDLKPLRKQVTFVLDVSGSMSGRKIEQLRQAMTTILDDLNKDDLFSIVLFSQTAQVWDPTLNETQMEERIRDLDNYHMPQEYQPPKPTPSAVVKADKEGVSKAKDFVSKLNALSSTAIYDGLMMALDISRLETDESKSSTAEKTEDQKPEPIIIFLTDGQPNVKVFDTNTIVKDVTKLNTKNSSIFSLALGNDADIDFLKKLSLRNSGFARKIYEAADTALQLRDFYREVASPLLANVTFAYSPEQVEEDSLTKYNFRRLFSGSELVVAGKLNKDKDFKGNVGGSSLSGLRTFDFDPIIIDDLPFIPEPIPEIPTNHTPSSMERMWAYLTIQQLLEEDKAKDYNHEDKNQTSPEKQKALEIALKYSFVTPLTSLVVVKPNETKPVDTEDASQSRPDFGPFSGAGFAGGFAPPQMAGAAGAPAYPAGGFGASFAAFPAVPMPANPCIPAPPNGPCGPPANRIPQPISEMEILQTEVFEENTTPFMPTAASAKLLTIEDLKWLPEITDNSTNTITLQKTGNTTADILKLASANETNIEYSTCSTPNGEDGHCRHLRFCVLDVFASNKEDFLPYLCHINEYVGTCCPNYI